MARLRINSKSAARNRQRVRNHRTMKRIRKNYENEVRAKIDSIEFVDGANLDSNFREESSTSDDNFDLNMNLRVWALNNNISHSAINELLAILIVAGFSFLPKGSRTLMGTPASVNISRLTNGKLWFCGLRQCFSNVFSQLNRDVTITLDFNVDGLPIFGSSKLQFWPILSAIRGNRIDLVQLRDFLVFTFDTNHHFCINILFS